MEDALLKGPAVCRILGIAPATLYCWVSQGKIEVTKVGGLNRYTHEAVDACLAKFKEGRNVARS